MISDEIARLIVAVAQHRPEDGIGAPAFRIDADVVLGPQSPTASLYPTGGLFPSHNLCNKIDSLSAVSEKRRISSHEGVYGCHVALINFIACCVESELKIRPAIHKLVVAPA